MIPFDYTDSSKVLDLAFLPKLYQKYCGSYQEVVSKIIKPVDPPQKKIKKLQILA